MQNTFTQKVADTINEVRFLRDNSLLHCVQNYFAPRFILNLLHPKHLIRFS